MYQTSAKRAALAIVAAAALVAVAAGCGTNSQPAGAGTTPTSVAATPAANDAAAVFVVQHGKVVSGPHAINAKLGSTVVIEVTTDIADEIHVHGYDKEVETKAGVAGRVSFVANIPGIFDVELHKSNVLLAELTVQ